MEAIENAAFVSVGRACGFAGLAVFCLTFGLSYEPILAARIGCFFVLVATWCLVVCALRARKRPYKHTELWLILAKSERPPAVIAQRIIGEALRETYLWFAQQAASVAVVFFAALVVLQLIEHLRP